MLDFLNQHTKYTRVGDPYFHIGPPKGLTITPGSPLFQTRCGLETEDGIWILPNLENGVKELCPQCRVQAGI